MRLKSMLAIAALFIATVSVPAQATAPDFSKISDLPAGVNIATHTTWGGTGASRMATNSNGSIVVMSDYSYFNKYSWDGNFPVQNSIMTGPRLYKSTDSGVTFTPLTGAPMADWGTLDMSEDGTKIIAIHQDAYISNNTKVSRPGAWLSNDGGATFFDLGLFRAGATNNWDVSMSGEGDLIIVTEDHPNYIPHYLNFNNMTWAPLNVPSGNWRTVSISRDGTIVALCKSDEGIFFSRDSGATFAKEISNLTGEGCGPMALSGDGSTLVLGRFNHPDKKVFHYAGNNSWTLVNTITGINGFHSTASVSISNNGQVIAIGDYRSNPNKVHISQNGGVSFTTWLEGTPGSYLPLGDVYVTLDGNRIFSLHSDGVYRLDFGPMLAPMPPAQVQTPAQVSPTPYEGPVLTANNVRAVAGGELKLVGSKLDQVTGIEVLGKAGLLLSSSSNQLHLRLPADLPAGLHDMTLRGSFGTLVVQGALRVSTDAPLAATWTKRVGSSEVRIFAKLQSLNAEVSVKVNGVTVADIGSASGNSRGLVQLSKGRNVIEVFVDGKRTTRSVYTGR